MKFHSSSPSSFSPQHTTSATQQRYAPPNGHNLSDMHVQSILIPLSEARAPCYCSAIHSHVTCFSLIASVTCQISLAATGKIARQSRAYLWRGIMQVLHGKEWPYEDKGSDFQKCTFKNDGSLFNCSQWKPKVAIILMMLDPLFLS